MFCTCSKAPFFNSISLSLGVSIHVLSTASGQSPGDKDRDKLSSVAGGQFKGGRLIKAPQDGNLKSRRKTGESPDLVTGESSHAAGGSSTALSPRRPGMQKCQGAILPGLCRERLPGGKD